MKKWFNKIDPLIVFFLLSLVFLYSFVGDVNYFLPKSKVSSFKNYVDSKFIFEYPQQGLLKNNESLKLYNPAYKLYYSVDGGKSYQSYNNESVLEIKSNNIQNKITSIRSKKPYGEMPEICSFLIKAEHKNGTQFTKPIQLTYYSNYNSNLPIVNLMINEDDLFDYKTGIMNLGEQSWFDDGFYKEFWYRKANYNQRGVSSKKQTYFQYFKDNELQYGIKTHFQISGNATRSFPQKSIKLKSIQNNKFEYDFFKNEGLKKYKSIVFRQSGNDNKKTIFADLLMQNLTSNLPVQTQKGFPNNIFINGNYWGVYNLRERYDTYYLGKQEKVNSKKITILEGGIGNLKKGSKKVRLKFLNLIDSVSNVTNINSDLFEFLKSKIDIQSFTYYILTETYFGNSDWLSNNVMWYKAGSKKWKWMLNDLDFSLAYNNSNNVNVNYFEILKQSKSITAELFNALMKNMNYNKYFKHNAMLFIETHITQERIRNEYDKLKTEIEPNIDFHISRWRGNFSKSEWEQNCNTNLSFLLERRQIFLNQVGKL